MAPFAFDMMRNIFSADIFIYIYIYFYLYTFDMRWRGTAAATTRNVAKAAAHVTALVVVAVVGDLIQCQNVVAAKNDA